MKNLCRIYSSQICGANFSSINTVLFTTLRFVRFVSSVRAAVAPTADPWGTSLKYLMGAVCASGGIIAAAYRHIQKNVSHHNTMLYG